MHIQDIFAQHRTTFSFEFFPPKTDAAAEDLFRTIARLQELRPSFVSVTYGAGGNTRERTHDLVVRIERDLIARVPRKHWVDLSHRLIAHGRGVCVALRPRCGECALAPLCPRTGVPAPARD